MFVALTFHAPNHDTQEIQTDIGILLTSLLSGHVGGVRTLPRRSHEVTQTQTTGKANEKGHDSWPSWP